MKFSTIKISILSFLVFPSFVFAQPSSPPEDFAGFVNVIVDLILLSIPLVFGLALALFLWGMAVFILNAGNEEKRKSGRQLMLWGIVGIFVMFSIWGLVAILSGTFFGDGRLIIPLLKTS